MIAEPFHIVMQHRKSSMGKRSLLRSYTGSNRANRDISWSGRKFFPIRMELTGMLSTPRHLSNQTRSSAFPTTLRLVCPVFPVV
ncbi:hypothetical protein D8S78_24680 [Natrialba swarupiae]|nr:hypothetical protein [Natrialba swarupiae]